MDYYENRLTSIKVNIIFHWMSAICCCFDARIMNSGFRLTKYENEKRKNKQTNWKKMVVFSLWFHIKTWPHTKINVSPIEEQKKSVLHVVQMKKKKTDERKRSNNKQHNWNYDKYKRILPFLLLSLKHLR